MISTDQTVTIPAQDAERVLDMIYRQWEQADARRVEIEERADAGDGEPLTQTYGAQLEEVQWVLRSLEDSLRILDDAITAARYPVAAR